MSKKDIYNTSPIDLRTFVEVNGQRETAIKPYHYFRNGCLHIRYVVDRCIELTPTESAKLKVDMSSSYDKQSVLAKAWNFFTTCVNKPIIADGIAEVERRIKRSHNGQ